jgi:hypothetical protein
MGLEIININTMESFNNFFHRANEKSEDDYGPMGLKPELGKRQAKLKVNQLIGIVKNINDKFRKVKGEMEQTEFSREEAVILKRQLAQLAKDLEGTRLPPEAHGLAGTATTALSGLQFNDSVAPIMKEAIQFLRTIINE